MTYFYDSELTGAILRLPKKQTHDAKEKLYNYPKIIFVIIEFVVTYFYYIIVNL